MALIADSGGVYALFDKRDRHHSAVRQAIDQESSPIIIPAAILGELDYLLLTRLGVDAEIRLLEGILRGAFTLEPFTRQDAVRCRELLMRYRGLALGLPDASVIATAERLGVHRILTVDERDFRLVRTSRGEPFVLLPADERRRRKR